MSEKIDLEKLEAKAKAATGESKWNGLPDGSWHEADHVANALDDFYESEQSAAVLRVDAEHIAANSPDVTLALIARIRELETALGEACRLGTRGAMWDSDIKRLRTILNRGTVLR
jgi:hypothetical protein